MIMNLANHFRQLQMQSRGLEGGNGEGYPSSLGGILIFLGSQSTWESLLVWGEIYKAKLSSCPRIPGPYPAPVGVTVLSDEVQGPKCRLLTLLSSGLRERLCPEG
jgi:hypothetical protein